MVERLDENLLARRMRRPFDQDRVSNLEGVVVDLGYDRAFILHEAADEAKTMPVPVEQWSLHLKISVQIEAVLVALVAQTKVLANQRRQRELRLEWLVRIRVHDVKEEHLIERIIVRDLFQLFLREISRVLSFYLD